MATDTELATGNDKKSKVKHKEDISFWSPENLRSIGVLVFIIFCFRWSVASPYHVPTASMEPTIKVGDRLLANKMAYGIKVPFTDISLANWSTPQKGDIIVFRYPNNRDIDYVKRVVGVAGDRLKTVDNVLYINGVAQERQILTDRKILEDIDDNSDIKTLYRENLAGTEHYVMQNIPQIPHSISPNWPDVGEVVVPENSVYVMGDNRDNSTDSRAWHEVPLNDIHGQAIMVLWSMYDWSPRFYRFGHVFD